MALLQFSDSTNKSGIVEVIRRRTGTNTASSGSYPIEDITVDVNMALANFFNIANKAAGKYQPVDDTRHGDFPVVYAPVTSGTADVTITQDEDGNQIHGIFKVFLTPPGGVKRELTQVDMDDEDSSYLVDSSTGTPDRYDLTAEGIVLYPTPNFSDSDALEVHILRAGKYFVKTDTAQRAGIPEIFDEYLTLRPSYFYCLEKGKPQASDYRVRLYGENGRGGMEADIKAYYARRNKGTQTVLSAGEVCSI